MSAWRDRVSDDDVRDLIAHIRTLARRSSRRASRQRAGRARDAGNRRSRARAARSSPRASCRGRALLPRLGDTERAALEAGSVGWDGELFSGRPDWGRAVRVSRETALGAEQPSSPGRSRSYARGSTTG
jgi:hypothetical protein